MVEHGYSAQTNVGSDRERTVTAAFVSIADSLVEGYDIVDLYSRLTADCARVLDIVAAGLLLADPRGTLQVVGASSERARDLELFVLQSEEGPCLDCYRTGEAVSVGDLNREAGRWPLFVPAALAVGIVSVHALPMRLQGQVLGTLGLFGTCPGALTADDLTLGQALAHVASVALVAGRAATDRTVVNEQLQTALNSRVVLEQAKGVLAQLGDLDMEHAFVALRRYARDHNRRLTDVAQAVVARDLLAQLVLDHGRAKGLLAASPTRPASVPRPGPGPRAQQQP